MITYDLVGTRWDLERRLARPDDISRSSHARSARKLIQVVHVRPTTICDLQVNVDIVTRFKRDLIPFPGRRTINPSDKSRRSSDSKEDDRWK